MRKLQISDIDRAANSLKDYVQKGFNLAITTEDRKGFYEIYKNNSNVIVNKIKSGRTLSSIKCTIGNCNIYIAQLLDNESCRFATFDSEKKEIICSQKL